MAAQEAEPDAISAMAPNFFKTKHAADLVDWFTRITEPVPSMPFYFYDIPGMTGVMIDTADFVLRALDTLPGFVGVKYTNPDREQLQRILAMEAAPDILWGCDEELLDGLKLGCRGAVGSSYNFAAAIYHRVMTAYMAGNLQEAQQWQERSLQLIETIAARGYMHSAKAVMPWVGVDCGPARPPLPQASPKEFEQLANGPRNYGFFRVDSLKQHDLMKLFKTVFYYFSFSVAAADRPNILFLFSDDHAVKAISAYGGPLAKVAPTPHIDRLAKEGVFLNSFCANSICGAVARDNSHGQAQSQERVHAEREPF